jgi:hypothetical protein
MRLEKSLLQNNGHKRLVIAICLCMCDFFNAKAQIGGQAGAYLRSPAGPVAFAMGGANSASPEDLCTWWNPAMLSVVPNTRIDLGGGLRSLGRTEGYSSVQFKISPRVGMGLVVLYRGDPDIGNLYDEDENALDNGAFSTFTAKAGLSCLVTRNLSIGLNIGYYYERLPTSYSGSSLDYSTATAMGGFDFALRYVPLKNWACAVILQNIDILKVLSGESATIDMDWEVLSDESGNSAITDKITPVAVFASQYDTRLAGKPFSWTCDIHAYAVDGDFTKLNCMEIRLNNGVEWKRWNTLCLRAGLGDMLLNRNIYNNTDDFWDEFSPRITIGFGADLSKIQRGLKVNYGIATDRTGAGVDQQMGFMYSF